MAGGVVSRRGFLERAAAAGVIAAGGSQLVSALNGAASGEGVVGPDRDPRRLTFVLVSGAWCGGWVWNRVARDLEGRGHRVVAPTLPGMSPGDDLAKLDLADATRYLVAEINRHDLRDVVLVAHDWSGIPVTAATHQVAGRLSSVVYWSAVVPLAGESMLDTIPASDAAALTGAAKAAGGDRVLVPYPRWQNRFVQTAPEDIRQLTYGHLRPQPWSYFTQSLKPSEASIPDLPVSYLVSAIDLSLPVGPEWWADKYAPRLGVGVTSFAAAHAAYFTEPLQLVDNLIGVSAPVGP